ncbi:MAG: carboxypeptidase regulatory-like domain-containing protein [Bryobacteraceae bacterium]
MAILGTALLSSVFGQADQGAITGTVSDAQGGVVASAKVKLVNKDTNFELQTSTDARGIYTFQPIRIGRYELSVSAPGFATTTQQDIQLQVNQRLGLDVSLRVGTQAEVVEVSGTAVPLLQTEDAATGKVVTSQEINDTPLSQRNYTFIAHLTAGVTPGPGSSTREQNGAFYANGQRYMQNNFILDGVDNNSNSVDMLNGATYVVKPPPDALQEFKIQTGSFSAEFGHSAGAVVNATLRSGTNRFTGNLWEYLRNDALAGTDLFALSGKPEYRQNQFGGTFGGPILKNKLFFFMDSEVNIIRSGRTVYASVPTDKMRQGNFSELLDTRLTGQANPVRLFQPGSAGTVPLTCSGVANALCPNQIDPLASQLFNMYPKPNTNGGRTFNNYTVNPVTADRTAQFDVRVDYNISAKDLAFARYSWTNEEVQTPGTFTGILGGLAPRLAYSQNGAFSESHIFSPNLTNEIRLGITWGNYFSRQGNFDQDIVGSLGMTGYPPVDTALGRLNGGLPNMTISGLTGIGSGQFTPNEQFQNIHQVSDNLTHIRGNHTLKVGVNYQQIRFSVLQPTAGRGTLNYSGKYTGQPGVSFTGSGMADFLANSMDSASLSGLNNTNLQRWYAGAYVQDDWKVTSRLTVNAGVRYDHFTAPYDRSDRQANWYFNSLGPGSGTGVYLMPESQKGVLPSDFAALLAKDHIDVQYTSNRSLINAPRLNFAPRLGIAYRVSDRLVLRSGAGMFYGGIENLGGFPVLGTNVPYARELAFTSPTCAVANGIPNCQTVGIRLQTGFATAPASTSTPEFRGSDPDWKLPSSYQWNFTLEQAIAKNLTLEVGYVGSATKHMAVVLTPNAGAALVAPGVNINPYRSFPDFGPSSYMQNAASATYHSLQTTFRRRYSNGLTFLATHTYSHSLDDAREPFPQSGEGGYRSYPILGREIEYSSSPFDARHRVTLMGTYELPFGAGKRFVNRKGLADRFVGGWSGTLVWMAQTGNPFTVRANTVVANGAAGGCCNSGAFPTLIGDPYSGGGTPPPSNPNIVCPAQVGNTANWYNPCAFANPPLGSLILPGQVLTGAAAAAFMPSARSQMHGPGYNRANMSLFKNFRVTERQYVQFRADVFNLLNHPSYGLPSQTLGNNAGQITSARSFGAYAPDARFFQLALKYYF